MSYADWKEHHQQPASDEQLERFKALQKDS
jgi:hypothetical protein